MFISTLTTKKNKITPDSTRMYCSLRVCLFWLIVNQYHHHHPSIHPSFHSSILPSFHHHPHPHHHHHHHYHHHYHHHHHIIIKFFQHIMQITRPAKVIILSFLLSGARWALRFAVGGWMWKPKGKTWTSFQYTGLVDVCSGLTDV